MKPKNNIMLEIETRRDMNEVFEIAMHKSYADILEKRKQEYEENLLKSYVVEYHEAEGNIDSLINSLIEVESVVGKIRKTKDNTLLHVEGKGIDVIIDALDSRFLLMHTLSKSVDSDDFIKKLIGYSVVFDRAWFTVQVLESFANIATPEGWEARFIPIELGNGKNKREETEQWAKEGTTSVSLMRRDAWEKYNLLKKSKLLPELPLDVINLRKYSNGLLARCRITSEGKMTARGNSFQEYQNLISIVQQKYSNLIAGIERKHGLEYKRFEKDFKMKGSPFLISFSRKLNQPELKYLLARMSAGNLPLKLIGMVEKRGENGYSINAIDLHVSCRIFFDINDSFIRAYLPQGSCANTLLRLTRDIQHHIDANVSMAV